MNIRTRYRNPRIPFSTIEVTTLERKFLQSPYLGSNDVNELATILNMSPKRVRLNIRNTTIQVVHSCAVIIIFDPVMLQHLFISVSLFIFCSKFLLNIELLKFQNFQSVKFCPFSKD